MTMPLPTRGETSPLAGSMRSDEWTRQTPACAGWYWYAGPFGIFKGESPAVVYVDGNGRVHVNGLTKPVRFLDLPGQWIGPIPAPPMPAESPR